MIILSLEHILALHERLIEESGGIQGVRDKALLESAFNAPFQSFADQDLFPSVTEKAVRLGYGLIHNHPFLDGNKRIGTHVMLVTLDLNGIQLSYDDDDLIEEILDIAAGEKNYQNLLDWVEKHMT